MPDMIETNEELRELQEDQQQVELQNKIVAEALKKRKKRPVRRPRPSKIAAAVGQAMLQTSLPSVVRNIQRDCTYGRSALAGLPTSQSVGCNVDSASGSREKRAYAALAKGARVNIEGIKEAAGWMDAIKPGMTQLGNISKAPMLGAPQKPAQKAPVLSAPPASPAVPAWASQAAKVQQPNELGYGGAAGMPAWAAQAAKIQQPNELGYGGPATPATLAWAAQAAQVPDQNRAFSQWYAQASKPSLAETDAAAENQRANDAARQSLLQSPRKRYGRY